MCSSDLDAADGDLRQGLIGAVATHADAVVAQELIHVFILVFGDFLLRNDRHVLDDISVEVDVP